mgnify:CR=1 FL=1
MIKRQKGFTLIEILVVIGILAILFGIALVAINPARQFSQANNTSRRNAVLAILNAVHQYGADNKGALPAGITTTAQTIGNGLGEANICANLVTKYLAALPRDPSVTGGDITDCAATHTTGYQVIKSATDNRVTVSAPSAELSETISVTR